MRETEGGEALMEVRGDSLAAVASGLQSLSERFPGAKNQ